MGDPATIISFDDFELDLARFELRHRGAPVQVERQCFDVLAYLVQARGRVVTKEELLDNVWGTRFVTESALTTQIKFARRAVGDDGTRQRFIRTVHRRGYEFVGGDRVAAEVRGSWAGSADADDPRPSTAGQAGRHLVGRDVPIADVTDMLSTHRLVTITGAGGVGKTQLALAVVADVARRFVDGVIQVDLAAVSDGADIAQAVAESAGLGRRDGASVPDAIAGARSLVVLDNCEHLIDGVAEFVERLLADPLDPARVLATSREPLIVAGEGVFQLGPLPTQGVLSQRSPAAELFFARAGRAAAESDLEDVERLVKLLDGLPLAIELAAAQLGFMSLGELHRRLEQHRFALATESRRSTRHDSLAASVAWSWQLLDAQERTTLIELSVFPGEFGLDGVERVTSTAEPLAVFRRLHTKSLVAGTRNHDTSRFRLLFGVRDFVRSRQSDLPAGPDGLRRRLATSFADLLDEWTFEEQWGSAEFLDVVLDERSTIHEISTIDDPEVAPAVVRVTAAAATSYRYGIGVAQGRAAMRTVDLSSLADDIAARFAFAGSEAAYAVGDVGTKDDLAQHAYERARAADRDDLTAVALTQQCVGRMLTEPERCARLLDDAVRHARICGSGRIESFATGLLAFCHLAGAGSLESAAELVGHADGLVTPSGWDRVSLTTVRGITLYLRGDRSEAAAEFRRVAEYMASVQVGGPAALFALLDVTCRADTAATGEIRDVVRDFMREYRRATGHAGRADALLLFAHRSVRAGDILRGRRLVDALGGRRLAHQVSHLILRDVAASVGVAMGVPADPPVGAPHSVSVLDELLELELAELS